MNNIPILSIIFSVLAILLGLYWKLSEKAVSNESRLSTMETKLNLFWKIVEQNVLTVLHHPDREEIDRVIDSRMASMHSSEVGSDYIKSLKMLITNNHLTPGERVAASVALAAATASSHKPEINHESKPFWKFW